VSGARAAREREQGAHRQESVSSRLATTCVSVSFKMSFSLFGYSLSPSRKPVSLRGSSRAPAGLVSEESSTSESRECVSKTGRCRGCRSSRKSLRYKAKESKCTSLTWGRGWGYPGNNYFQVGLSLKNTLIASRSSVGVRISPSPLHSTCCARSWQASHSMRKRAPPQGVGGSRESEQRVECPVFDPEAHTRRERTYS
jgi:hypothetical protein